MPCTPNFSCFCLSDIHGWSFWSHELTWLVFKCHLTVHITWGRQTSSTLVFSTSVVIIYKIKSNRIYMMHLKLWHKQNLHANQCDTQIWCSVSMRKGIKIGNPNHFPTPTNICLIPHCLAVCCFCLWILKWYILALNMTLWLYSHCNVPECWCVSICLLSGKLSPDRTKSAL